MIKTLSIAALVATSATASFAGSLTAPAEETVVFDTTPVAPVSGSGIGVPVVIGGVLAAAAIAALVDNDNDSDDTTELDD